MRPTGIRFAASAGGIVVMSVWMSEGAGYMPPSPVGEVMRSIGVGQVVDSRRDDLPDDEGYGKKWEMPGLFDEVGMEKPR